MWADKLSVIKDIASQAGGPVEIEVAASNSEDVLRIFLEGLNEFGPVQVIVRPCWPGL